MTDTQDLRPHIRAALAAGDPSGGVMTRKGREVVIYTTDAAGDTLIHGYIPSLDWLCAWSPSGRGDGLGGDQWDLIPRPTPKRRVSGWVNVYSDGDGGCVLDGGYPTRAHADRRASADRIACIEIDVEEGEGL